MRTFTCSFLLFSLSTSLAIAHSCCIRKVLEMFLLPVHIIPLAIYNLNPWLFPFDFNFPCLMAEER